MKKNNLNLIKSLGVAIIFTSIDFLFHSTIWNPETTFYFIIKFMMSFYFVFLVFNSKFNFLNLKNNTFTYYFYYSSFFALLHGLYYRLLELLYNQTLFSRVGDLNLGFIVLNASTSGLGILIAILNGFLIHSIGFLLSISLINRIIK